MDSEKIHEIKSITFGVFSAKELIKMSVAEITSTKLSGGIGTVYDERMGTIENGNKCETCKEGAKICPGHQGHVVLNEPIIHPLFYKEVRDFLTCVCIKCYRIILTLDQIMLDDIIKYTKSERFDKILEKIKKIDTCFYCNTPQPVYKYNPNDNNIQMVYKDKDTKITSTMIVDDILKILDSIIDDDVKLMGFDPSLMHPRNLIMTVFPLIPPSARPYVIADGNVCDDDLTNQSIEIVKANTHLKKDNPALTENKQQKYLQILKFRISTFFDNSLGKSKHTTNGRPIKGIKERFAGKSGQLRNNLMGKRCLDPETPVLMWSGDIKKAKNICTGNNVVGENGEKRTVIDTFQGKDIMYTVTNIRTKQSYTVNKNHILTLVYPDQGRIRWFDGYTTIKNGKKITYGILTMRWYNRTTEQFVKTTCKTHDEKSKEDAYANMMLLQKHIDLSPIIDMSVLTYLNLDTVNKTLLFIYKLNTPVKWESSHELESVDDYNIGVEYAKNILGENEVDSSWRNKLCSYNVASRFSILKGIVDTIGVVSNDKSKINISITVYNNNLKFLAESLGLNVSVNKKCSIQDKFTNWSSRDSVSYEISGNISKINPDYKDSSNFIDIFTVTLADTHGDYCSFEINGDTKRFVLGDFHITHNCEQTGRTVIGPDPTLKMGQLSIPREIANNLTVPERVSTLNYDRLTKIVNSGKANFILKNGGPTKINLKYALFRTGTELIYGDEIIRQNGEKDPIVIKVATGKEKIKEGDMVKRNGVFISDLKYPEKKNYVLNIGDVVERKLQDNDWVILNRQPTEQTC